MFGDPAADIGKTVSVFSILRETGKPQPVRRPTIMQGMVCDAVDSALPVNLLVHHLTIAIQRKQFQDKLKPECSHKNFQMNIITDLSRIKWQIALHYVIICVAY